MMVLLLNIGMNMMLMVIPKLENDEQTSVDLQKLKDDIINNKNTVKILKRQMQEAGLSVNTDMSAAERIANMVINHNTNLEP